MAPAHAAVLTPFLLPLIQYLRSWDRKGSEQVEKFVAISRFVSARIRRFYGRRAHVIYPPVDTQWIGPRTEGQVGEAFLYAGALVPYKRADLAIEAFNKLGQPLWVVGSGPQEKKLRAMANSNITFLGRLSDEQLAQRYRRCRALIFPGCEDFGIIPIECMAAGRPVIALFDGALRETLPGIRHWQANNTGQSSSLDIRRSCGVFIDKRGDRLEAIVSSVNYFLRHEDQFSAAACVEHARQFGRGRFLSAWNNIMAMPTGRVGELDHSVMYA